MSESIYPQNPEVEKLPKLVNKYEIPTFEEKTDDYWRDYPYGSTKIQLRPGIEVAQDSETVWALFTSASWTIANTTQTTPTWSGGASSDSSILGTNQFTIPSSGTYQISWTIRWNGTAGGIRQAILLVGWTFITAGVQPSNGWANDEYCNFSVMVACTQWQAVKCDVYQTSWVSVSLVAANCKFSMTKIS